MIDRKMVCCLFILFALFGFDVFLCKFLYLPSLPFGIVHRCPWLLLRVGQDISSACVKFLSLRQGFDKIYEFNNLPKQYDLFGVLFAWLIYLSTVRAVNTSRIPQCLVNKVVLSYSKTKKTTLFSQFY